MQFGIVHLSDIVLDMFQIHFPFYALLSEMHHLFQRLSFLTANLWLQSRMIYDFQLYFLLLFLGCVVFDDQMAISSYCKKLFSVGKVSLGDMLVGEFIEFIIKFPNY